MILLFVGIVVVVAALLLLPSSFPPPLLLALATTTSIVGLAALLVAAALAAAAVAAVAVVAFTVVVRYSHSITRLLTWLHIVINVVAEYSLLLKLSLLIFAPALRSTPPPPRPPPKHATIPYKHRTTSKPQTNHQTSKRAACPTQIGTAKTLKNNLQLLYAGLKIRAYRKKKNTNQRSVGLNSRNNAVSPYHPCHQRGRRPTGGGGGGTQTGNRGGGG